MLDGYWLQKVEELLKNWESLYRQGFDQSAQQLFRNGAEEFLQHLQERIDRRRSDMEWEEAVEAVLDHWEEEYEEGRDHTVQELSPRWPEEWLEILDERIAVRRAKLRDIWAMFNDENVVAEDGGRFIVGCRVPGTDYFFTKRLGAGGFGETWLAANPRMGDEVVFKFCSPRALDSLKNEAELLRRMKDELRRLQADQHFRNGFVQMLGSHLDTEPYYVMYEYVSGGDLRKFMERLGRRCLTPIEAADIVLQLAEHMALAHRLSDPIFHRDLKPENILISGSDSFPLWLKIADFGIGGVALTAAVAEHRSMKDYAANLSTCSYEYASPQQRNDPSRRVANDDVHALAVIWNELLTGMVGTRCGKDWVRQLKSLGMEDEQIDFLEECLAMDEQRRSGDAGEMAQKLHELFIEQLVDFYRRRGCDAYVADDHAKAIASFERIVELEPGNSSHYSRLGSLHRRLAVGGGQQDGLNEAITLYHKALILAPHTAVYESLIGSAYRQQGRYEEAIASYRKALALAPNDASYHKSLGDMLCDAGRTNEAVSSYRRAVDLETTDASYYKSLGDALRELGHFKEALASYRKAVELEPNDALLQVVLGDTCRRLAPSNVEEAIICYEEAIHLDPSNAAYRKFLGDAWHELGDNGWAIYYYEEAVRLEPQNASLREAFGAALLRQFAYKVAIETYQELVRLRPDKQSRAALAEAYLRAKCYDDAATSYQELTNFEPDNASYHEFLGRALYNLGRNDEAIDACERAATLDPSVGSVRCLLGHAYCRAKRYDEAIKSCCDAVALDKSPYLQKALGDMYYKAERYDEAVAAYEAAVMLEPGVASFWKAIGDAYRATKRHEQAAASYDKQKALEQAESTKMQELPLRLIQGTLEAKRRDSKLVVMREAKRRARRP